MTIYAEKLLPHDVEAEEAVLGSILIDGECLTQLAPLLKEGDFYRGTETRSVSTPPWPCSSATKPWTR